MARIFPENETNNALTSRLSRIHTFLERTAQGIRVRDGNGRGPSLNGSFLNGEALATDPPMLLPGRSVLWLGEEYAVELVPVFPEARAVPAIENLDAWNGSKPEDREESVSGALVCLPMNGQPIVRQTAWLFTEAGFGLDAAEHLVWDTRGRPSSPASFHYFRGQFWLSNRSLPETALTCHECPLGRDHIAPLVPGQTVGMGAHAFVVHAE